MINERVNNARKKVREEIARKNINVVMLAKKAGVASKTVYNFLNGAEPKLSTFVALCEKLGLSADELLGFEGKKK